MKPKPSLAYLIGWLACFLAPTQTPFAADPPSAAIRDSGTITGRVQNGQTGLYLNNARISIKGTNVVAFTDQTGTYRLVGVPQGNVVLEAFFTGLDPQQMTMNVVPGQATEQNFQLGSGSVVTLDKFTVTGAADLETIATNEQRFAANLKLVAAPGENEFVLEGNVGEFMKSLPGVSAEYSDVEIMGISVRGFGSNVVGVSAGTSTCAATSSDSASRRPCKSA